MVVKTFLPRIIIPEKQFDFEQTQVIDLIIRS